MCCGQHITHFYNLSLSYKVYSKDKKTVHEISKQNDMTYFFTISTIQLIQNK